MSSFAEISALFYLLDFEAGVVQVLEKPDDFFLMMLIWEGVQTCLLMVGKAS